MNQMEFPILSFITFFPLLGAAILLFMQSKGDYFAYINFPFFKQFHPDLQFHDLMRSPLTYWLGVSPFCLFVALIVVGSSNAVNLTDGLDGLAIGLMVIASGALTMLAYAGGHVQLAEYLQIARNPRTSELTIFCGSMTGASLSSSRSFLFTVMTNELLPCGRMAHWRSAVPFNMQITRRALLSVNFRATLPGTGK